MDPPPHHLQFNNLWAAYQPAPLPELLPVPDYHQQQQYFSNSLSNSPTPSAASSHLSSPTLSTREETIHSLHEARKQKRREQNKAAQRKFRLRKEQTEVQLRTDLVDAEKHLEDLRKDNSRLLQELCSIRRENLVWRARQGEGDGMGEKGDEMRELEAMERRLGEGAGAGSGSGKS
ncbi:hypothetical protein M409DRAFT_26631 [Zasmidium cellare ATCC 36951]|uniref:BZIP domain-containing protein n=1 Tax=Zasmidium cellare ATCC 36951 TaxID=1080233 RepID=A0A6A6CAD4_ZASCE|nr:uncharacterized protein M409DRAFT_26631 [Zasmidium cellare ATCC 36951]KAF2163188.1 hypothetical protein M409DRAFT_26631 [Zasmidium cellare ATCC 36951]